jgi:hypothetical protein
MTETKLKRIDLEVSTHGWSTGGYDPEDSWSRDSTDGTWSIDGYRESTGKYGDFVYVGSTDLPVYVIAVGYSTGDSFGRDGGQYEILAATNDEEKAKNLVLKLNKDLSEGYKWTTGNEIGNQVTFIDDEGKEETIYTGTWKGYFEGCDSIEYYEVRKL